MDIRYVYSLCYRAVKVKVKKKSVVWESIINTWLQTIVV